MTPAQSAALSAIESAVAVLRASLADPVPPPPPVEPPPVEPPATISQRSRAIIDRTRVVCFAGWLNLSSYDRFPSLDVLAPGLRTLTIRGYSLEGPALRAMSAATYTITANGQSVGTVTVPAGAQTASATVDLSASPDGWVTFDIANPGTGETMLPWTAYMLRGTVATNQLMLIEQANYDVIKHRGPSFRWGLISGAWNPTPRPLLAPLLCPSIPTLTAQSQLKRTHLVPWRLHNADSYRPTTRADGIRHCVNPQPYAYSQLVAKTPQFPNLDGPRGVGTITMPTHIQVGRTGGAYVLESHRLTFVSPLGEVRTLVGVRHAYPGAAPELVGDWSAVPPDRRGMIEAWGLCFDPRTTTVGGTPIPNDGNGGVAEQPHTQPVRSFLADTQRNRILRLTHGTVSHLGPAVVEEWITGLSDPFDVQIDGSTLYVSERTGHKISKCSADTPETPLGVLTSGAALSTVSPERLVRKLATLTAIRAEPCVGPEGLALQDRWLYFGSVSMEQIRRAHLDTGAVEVVDPQIKADGNSHFVKIALSDGTFGPRGKVFYSSWTSQNAGHPTGLPTNWSGAGGQGAYTGPGAPWETHGYSAAVGVGLGRLICGSSSEGLTVVHAAAGEPAISTAQWAAWFKAWTDAGMHLLHDWQGYGHLGLPLPWGQGHDDYLTACGHTKGN